MTYHWGELGKVYGETLCIVSYNYVNLQLFQNKSLIKEEAQRGFYLCRTLPLKGGNQGVGFEGDTDLV